MFEMSIMLAQKGELCEKRNSVFVHFLCREVVRYWSRKVALQQMMIWTQFSPYNVLGI